MGAWGHRRETERCHWGLRALPLLTSALETGTLLSCFQFLPVTVKTLAGRWGTSSMNEVKWSAELGPGSTYLLMECIVTLALIAVVVLVNFPLCGQTNTATRESGRNGFSKASSSPFVNWRSAQEGEWKATQLRVYRSRVLSWMVPSGSWHLCLVIS